MKLRLLRAPLMKNMTLKALNVSRNALEILKFTTQILQFAIVLLVMSEIQADNVFLYKAVVQWIISKNIISRRWHVNVFKAIMWILL